MKTTTNSQTEETIVDNKTVNSTECKEVELTNQTENKPIWKNVLIGGITGVALGFSGTAFAAQISNNNFPIVPDNTDTPPDEIIPSVSDGVHLSITVTDDMSFGEAFSSARAELGAGGVFEWHGQLYSTYYQEEWESMTDNQKDEFMHEVYSVDVDNNEVSVTTEDIVEEVIMTDDIDSYEPIPECVYGPPEWFGYHNEFPEDVTLQDDDALQGDDLDFDVI